MDNEVWMLLGGVGAVGGLVVFAQALRFVTAVQALVFNGMREKDMVGQKGQFFRHTGSDADEVGRCQH